MPAEGREIRVAQRTPVGRKLAHPTHRVLALEHQGQAAPAIELSRRQLIDEPFHAVDEEPASRGTLLQSQELER